MKKKLPLDPFDWRTLVSYDYQFGNLAWAILLLGVALGAYLIVTADPDRLFGWFKISGGIGVIFGATYLARRMIRSI